MSTSLSRKNIVIDLALSLGIIHASFWVYEFGNLISLYAAGAPSRLLVRGILPLGVVAGPVAMTGPYTKLIQVAFATGFILVPLGVLKRRNMPLTKIVLLVVLSCYASSLSWEMLGHWASLPAWASPAVFGMASIALASTVMLGDVLDPFRVSV